MRGYATLVVVFLAASIAGDQLVSARSGRDARVTQASQDSVPGHLRIVSAEIEELVPINRNIARRQVRLRIGTAAAPVCPASAGTEYGFLIDADKSLATGVSEPSFDRLGIDARVVMRCDEKTGRFVSPIGRVTVRAAGAPGLDLVTTAGQLPSVDFLWVPYGANGHQLSLLPEAPRFSRWAIFERSIP